MRNNRPPSEGKKSDHCLPVLEYGSWCCCSLFSCLVHRASLLVSIFHFPRLYLILDTFLLCSLLNSTAHFLLHYYRLFFLFSLLRREMILNLEVRTQRFTYLHLNMSVCDFFVHSLKGISHRDIGFLRKIYILFLKISNVPSYHLVVGI